MLGNPTKPKKSILQGLGARPTEFPSQMLQSPFKSAARFWLALREDSCDFSLFKFI